jgi:hypothetical protein
MALPPTQNPNVIVARRLRQTAARTAALNAAAAAIGLDHEPLEAPPNVSGFGYDEWMEAADALEAQVLQHLAERVAAQDATPAPAAPVASKRAAKAA